MKRLFFILLAFCSLGQAWAIDLEPLESIAVQEGGRKKPLLTYANESLQKINGRATWRKSPTEKLTAMQVMMSMLFAQDVNWDEARIIRCTYMPLKRRLGLPEEQLFYSVRELGQNRTLLDMIEQIRTRRQAANPEFDKIENEAETLAGRMIALKNMASGTGLRIIPHPQNARGEWMPITEVGAYYPDKEKALMDQFQAIARAYQANDSTALANAAITFKQSLRQLSPTVYPPDARLQLELNYMHHHPFRVAWVIYALAFILMLCATRTGTGFRGRLYWPAMVLYLCGLSLQIYGFYCRSAISGRPPVTNMYEVMIWIAFGAALFAAIFEFIYKPRYFVLAASAVGTLSLVLADNLPAVLDPAIKPLVPVLVNNYWLTVHVLTITLGYAGFMLALGMGHIVLGYYVFKPTAQKKINELTQFNYRAMQVGLLFLTAGTILGGVWANDSWGRFWGWDPKETWALIAILCYLVVLHGRFAGWMGDFALNVASVVCFQAIIFAAYGVNFVLGKGLHSYGFGVGGEWAVASYVGLELAIVGLAVWRYKLGQAKSAQQEQDAPGSAAEART